ncbi:substrate-binding domain-containing protein [Flavobacterium sp. HSC-61S13]|uniref:substrate-binding domain-containing protein n=1 Tax=Flavobacterium sp. HSC-61S13 TaxID=2910963 RepID=UPI00209D89F1|nr:substrate-binding domain-containing protein [Flavobacterium sp. HSC-61S13]MCP1995854.1 ABC-type nitrate/sulfonate/bicarbonate transport system substrate-binding protein [Flavobacterium sp. HSC-61S13]
MKTVRIAGVPEHFNLPWHLAIDSGDFEAVDLNLEWTDIPEGTGKMCQMLRDGSTDLAVILTEGIVKDIALGNACTIVQEYVSSPLLWGIHVNASSDFNQVGQLLDKTAAISRLGSGSHLMALVHAKQQNWNTEVPLKIVNTIDGAVNALTNGEADYFMWERFMTQPLVDQGVFRRIGQCPTPWPSFVIVCRNEYLEQHGAVVEHVLEIINNTTAEFKQIPSIDRTLASKFNQQVTDIQQWLQLTQWSQKKLNQQDFEAVQKELLALNLITKPSSYQQVVKS